MSALVKSYADKINARYSEKKSHFVSLKERLNSYLQGSKTAQDELNNAMKDFKKNYPTIKWNQISLAMARECKLSEILIDDTMNRPVDWNHVRNILRKFKQTSVMGINVYQDPEVPGKYVAWDGQHTAIVLYIISTMICNEAASKITIPIVIYNTTNKAEIRENFVVLNSSAGKLKLSKLALYNNMIFGVRIDGSTNPEWLEANEKQKILEKAGLFLTERGRGDTSENGAITRIENVLQSSKEDLKNFATYWTYRKIYEDRSVRNKELILLLQFVELCRKSKIKLTDAYMKQVADIFWSAFECDFNPTIGLNPFFAKLDIAYRNWYKKTYHPQCDYEEINDVFSDTELLAIAQRPRLDMTTEYGTTEQDNYFVAFMIAILQKNGFKGKLPESEVPFFKPDPNDIW